MNKQVESESILQVGFDFYDALPDDLKDDFVQKLKQRHRDFNSKHRPSKSDNANNTKNLKLCKNGPTCKRLLSARGCGAYHPPEVKKPPTQLPTVELHVTYLSEEEIGNLREIITIIAGTWGATNTNSYETHTINQSASVSINVSVQPTFNYQPSNFLSEARKANNRYTQTILKCLSCVAKWEPDKMNLPTSQELANLMDECIKKAAYASVSISEDDPAKDGPVWDDARIILGIRPDLWVTFIGRFNSNSVSKGPTFYHHYY